MIDPTAVLGKVEVGQNTSIWQFCLILDGVTIGSNCNICSHVYIESGVKIGNNVTIKNGARIYKNALIEDNVFIGPNVIFTNDPYPKSKNYPLAFPTTRIHANASLGAGVILLPGVSIGAHTLVGAGAVVTRSLPDHVLAFGNPARIISPRTSA